MKEFCKLCNLVDLVNHVNLIKQNPIMASNECERKKWDNFLKK